MERITKRHHNMNRNILDEALYKLKELEDIEESFGIELKILIRALRDGVYDMDGNYFNNLICVGYRLVQTHACYAVKRVTLESCYTGEDTESCTPTKEGHYWSWESSPQFDLKDYGKTWRLPSSSIY